MRHSVLRQKVGLEARVTDLPFANTEGGAEHYFFLATPLGLGRRPWEDPQPPSDGASASALRRSTLLGYPIRPVDIARRLRQRQLA